MRQLVETNIPASSWAGNSFRDQLGAFQVFFNIFALAKFPLCQGSIQWWQNKREQRRKLLAGDSSYGQVGGKDSKPSKALGKVWGPQKQNWVFVPGSLS